MTKKIHAAQREVIVSTLPPQGVFEIIGKASVPVHIGYLIMPMDLGVEITAIDVQRLHNGVLHVIVKPFTNGPFQNPGHQSRPKIGVPIAGSRLGGGEHAARIHQFLQGAVRRIIAGRRVGGGIHNAGGMLHEHPGCKRYIRVIRRTNFHPEITADVRVQIDSPLFPQPHDRHAGHQFGNGGDPVFGILARRGARLLIGVAIRMAVDDRLPAEHGHRHAGHTMLFTDGLNTLLQIR